MDRDWMFVDDYSFDAYRAAGFGRFDRADREMVKNIKMNAPDLGGFGEWMNYFSIVGKVSPVPKDLKFGEVPEGVLWTGGTFVIEDNSVLYQWTDTVPGNHPVIQDIVEIAKDAAQKKKRNTLPGKIGWF
ncbi:hypothetical protein ACHAXA_009591 [Cyclostephanos tholiformis]|uniref:Uncharacterized protein n=1 Tax=Cyclostephanos tholiformis TaxID=382380 RepID=A0ABD3RGH8_9STRA